MTILYSAMASYPGGGLALLPKPSYYEKTIKWPVNHCPIPTTQKFPFCTLISNSHLNKVGCLIMSKEKTIVKIQIYKINNEIIEIESKGLIYHFLGIWPHLLTIKAWVDKEWNLNRGVSISLYSHGCFLAYFDSEKDQDLVSQNGLWFLGKVSLFMKLWHMRFKPTLELPSIAPI